MRSAVGGDFYDVFRFKDGSNQLGDETVVSNGIGRFFQTPKAGSHSLTRPGDIASNESPQQKFPKKSPI
jgi:hypothetical protein